MQSFCTLLGGTAVVYSAVLVRIHFHASQFTSLAHMVLLALQYTSCNNHACPIHSPKTNKQSVALAEERLPRLL
jgi:hypothetical protein